jgi:hypothetical protein
MNVFLEWHKCKAGTWCTLSELDLEHQHFDDMEGVYIIWCGEQNTVALSVGQGYIRDCLAKERNLKYVSVIGRRYQIHVTWAKIGSSFRKGVAKYISEAIRPKLARSYQNAAPIEVNLPAPWYEESFPWE